MFVVYKNKGILVIVYLIFSLIGCALLAGVLQRNVGGIFSNFDINAGVGLGFLVAAALTWFTRHDYYKDNDGSKKRLDTENSLFFIRMEIWAYIFAAIALMMFGNALFGYFD